MQMARLLAATSCTLLALTTIQSAWAQEVDDADRLCNPVISADGTAVRSASGSMVGHGSSAPCPEEPVVVVTQKVVVVEAEPSPPAPAGAVVYFPYDVAELTPEAERIVDDLADMTADRQPSSVLVAGHADRAGQADYNQDLSEERAASVESALVERGLPETLVTTEAFGETDPAVATQDGVALDANRRAVVTVDY